MHAPIWRFRGDPDELCVLEVLGAASDGLRPGHGRGAGVAVSSVLERAGVVTGVITQNVDLLHTKAGSRTVVNLHGTYAQVICLDCRLRTQ